MIGIPLYLGLAVAIAAIAAAFAFIGGLAGLIVLLAVLVLALGISYRIVTDSDPQD